MSKLKLKKFRRKKTKAASFKLCSTVFIPTTELIGTNLDKFNFHTGSSFDNTGYTICNELSKRCLDISYLPNTQTIVMSDKSFCSLMENSSNFIADVGKGLNLNKEQSINHIQDFFAYRSILVQQKGIPGFVYQMGTFTQTAGSVTMVTRTVRLAQLAGVSGFKLIQAQPLLIVVVPTVGAIFFHGCAVIAGPNTIGRTFNSVANGLNLPMRLCEMMYNSYVSPMVIKVTGIPTILNYTEQMKRGPGLDSREALKLFKEAKEKSYVKKAIHYLKCWVIKSLGGTC